MFAKNRIVRGAVVFMFLTFGVLSLSRTAAAAAPDHDDINKVQQSLSDKGFYHGRVDGLMGPQTRRAIAEYQRSEHMPATSRLDVETSGKLGVGPESEGGKFDDSGHQVAEGGKEAGHEIKNGKPVAAGKELGKGIGRAAKDIGQGVKKAVTPESDRGDREKKQEDGQKKPQ